MAKSVKHQVSTQYLADLFNLSDRRIQQLASEDDNEKQIFYPLDDKKPFKFDLIKSVKSYVQYLQEIINGKQSKLENIKKEGNKLDVDIQLKELKLKTAQLEFEELDGNMHRSEDVQYMMSDLILTTRSMLIAIPSRVSDDLANITEPQEINHILQTEIFDILKRLSQYKYDPEKFKERVNERRNISVDDEQEYFET